MAILNIFFGYDQKRVAVCYDVDGFCAPDSTILDKIVETHERSYVIFVVFV